MFINNILAPDDLLVNKKTAYIKENRLCFIVPPYFNVLCTIVECIGDTHPKKHQLKENTVIFRTNVE